MRAMRERCERRFIAASVGKSRARRSEEEGAEALFLCE
jgi:hypothetical protein